ncbi:MAG: PKD domain-containing protein [Gaiellaceae bacterium]
MRKTLLRLCLAVFSILALALPGSAAAATQSVSPTFTGDGANTDIVSLIAVCDECAPDIFFSGPFNTWGLGLEATVQAQASWSNPSSVEMSYTQSNLRHGQTLDLSDKLTTGAGTVHVTYSVSGLLGLYGTLQTGNLSCADAAVSGASCNGWEPTTSTLSIGPITGSDDIPCVMPLPGESPRDCTATESITIWNTDIFDFVDIEVNLILEETVHVTGTGVASLRIAVIAGGPAIPNNNLSFGGSSPSTVADPIFINCSQPVGNSLLYSLTNLDYTANPATYTGAVKIGLEATVIGFPVGSFTTPALFATTGANLGPIAMSAPDQQVDLGPVLPNNIPPTVDTGGPYSGDEGSPITFDGTGTTSPCGFANLTLVWNFSDGGVAFGATPQHTFLSPGIFSGLLTVTDSDGNVASKAFSITVANLAPVANAGPDMSTKWGIPITLNGSAVDPGTDTQPFLTYSWDFGDGTPSASGGPSVNHTYALPGTYMATFTSCDPLNACDSDQTQVVVSKRDTTTTYTGPNQSNPSKEIALSATVVDEFGQAVVGRTVSFVLGAQSISATTNSSGVASATIKLNQHKGDYTVSATFAGDTKYVGSADSGTFTIGQQ